LDLQLHGNSPRTACGHFWASILHSPNGRRPANITVELGIPSEARNCATCHMQIERLHDIETIHTVSRSPTVSNAPRAMAIQYSSPHEQPIAQLNRRAHVDSKDIRGRIQIAPCRVDPEISAEIRGRTRHHRFRCDDPTTSGQRSRLAGRRDSATTSPTPQAPAGSVEPQRNVGGLRFEAMYNLYIMRRTQIYLSDNQGSFLERRARATGRTMSQLIREAIDAAYSSRRHMSRTERVHIARRTAGAWTDFPETGAQYVKRIRTGKRLTRVRAGR
jgi:hypothetical protein